MRSSISYLWTQLPLLILSSNLCLIRVLDDFLSCYNSVAAGCCPFITHTTKQRSGTKQTTQSIKMKSSHIVIYGYLRPQQKSYCWLRIGRKVDYHNAALQGSQGQSAEVQTAAPPWSESCCYDTDKSLLSLSGDR